jgi:hypothetical protein
MSADMTVAAASCWSYPAKLSTTRAWMIDHCAGALLDKDRNGWVRHHRDISAYLSPSGAGGVPPPVQESHVTRLSKKSLWARHPDRSHDARRHTPYSNHSTKTITK